MNFTPLLDRVVVFPDPTEEKTEAGIILSEQNKSSKIPIAGTVAVVGPGRTENGTLVPTTVKRGDRVMWTKYVGSFIILNGEQYVLMRESDISGVISE